MRHQYVLTDYDGSTLLPNVRSPTNLSSAQGHHVTAYALFKRRVLKATNGSKNKKYIYEKAVGLVGNINIDYEMLIALLKEKLNKRSDGTPGNLDKLAAKNEDYALSDRELQLIIEQIEKIMKKSTVEIHNAVEKTKQMLEEGLISPMKRKNVLQHTIPGGTTESYHELINRACDTHNQTCYEKAINYLLNQYIILSNQQYLTSYPKEGNLNPDQDEGAQITRALMDLDHYQQLNIKKQKSHKEITKLVQAVQDLLWFPKIPKNIQEKKEILHTRGAKAGKVKYKKGILPRNNDLDIAAFIVARHLYMILDDCITVDAKIQADIRYKYLSVFIKNWGLSRTLAAAFKKRVISQYFSDTTEEELSGENNVDSTTSMATHEIKARLAKSESKIITQKILSSTISSHEESSKEDEDYVDGSRSSLTTGSGTVIMASDEDSLDETFEARAFPENHDTLMNNIVHYLNTRKNDTQTAAEYLASYLSQPIAIRSAELHQESNNDTPSESNVIRPLKRKDMHDNEAQNAPKGPLEKDKTNRQQTNFNIFSMISPKK